VVYRADQGLEAFHELHKFAAGGFRGLPHLEGRALISFAGQGGENGAFARMTDPGQFGNVGDQVGVRDVEGVKAFFLRNWNALRDFPLDRQHWSTMTTKLIAADNLYVANVVGSNFDVGYFTDPRQQTLLRGVTSDLLNSEPNTPQRIASASALFRNYELRDQLLDRVSVSGVTAEIQMAQVLHRYLRLDEPNKSVDVRVPGAAIDVVAVYQLYRGMLDSGILTNRSTIESWLRDWGVIHVP
jgi:hypothetical protein